MGSLEDWVRKHLLGQAAIATPGVEKNAQQADAASLLTEGAAHTRFSVDEREETLLVGARRWEDQPQDRPGYDRQRLLEDCLDAWRYNPLGRRIVELTSQYVVGEGMSLRCEHAPSAAFLQAFWGHRLNRLAARLISFSDELARTGNLFLLVSTDAAGMSYVREVPSSAVESIHSRANDLEQELSFTLKAELGEEPVTYPAWQAEVDAARMPGDFQTVMLHYAVNRPAGAQWGEPDLAPVLKWLSRYAYWLEDRVRLNRYRNAFLYVVKARYGTEAERKTRQLQLAANPPAPGSILVTDESEEWSILSPKLEALDASTDGLAIKKMIAAGVGLPLHFLAEPESSTRTTAEAAGGPTFRRFEQRQRYLRWVMSDLLRLALTRRAMVDPAVDANCAIALHAADISSRDNSELATAGKQATEVAQAMLDRGLIDKDEARRLIYRFLGEQLPHA